MLSEDVQRNSIVV